MPDDRSTLARRPRVPRRVAVAWALGALGGAAAARAEDEGVVTEATGAASGEPLVPRAETKAIVLLYHGIEPRGDPRTVWPWSLRAQVERMRRRRIEIIAASRLVDFVEGRIERLPARVAVLTFDDGAATFFRTAWPMLRAERVPFALGIISHAASLGARVRALDWEQLRELTGSGLCEVASHGHDHHGLAGLGDEALAFELTRSRALIERGTGRPPDLLFLPLGSRSARVVLAAHQAGYRASFTAVGGTVTHGSWAHKIPRFEMHTTTTLGALRVFFELPEAPLDVDDKLVRARLAGAD